MGSLPVHAWKMIFMSSPNRSTHIRLTSHPEPSAATSRHPIRWAAEDPRERGPIIGSVTNPADRNVIGAHGGSYSLYRALAISARALNPLARPDLHNTHPVVDIGPHPQWFEPRSEERRVGKECDSRRRRAGSNAH